jgi:hypothetical protein
MLVQGGFRVDGLFHAGELVVFVVRDNNCYTPCLFYECTGDNESCFLICFYSSVFYFVHCSCSFLVHRTCIIIIILPAMLMNFMDDLCRRSQNRTCSRGMLVCFNCIITTKCFYEIPEMRLEIAGRPYIVAS